MVSYSWGRSRNIPAVWTAFDPSTNPPIKVISLPVPTFTTGTLMRTVADVEYAVMVLNSDRVIQPIYGSWEEPQVTCSLWADPTGLVASAAVPKPFTGSTHIPPTPVWEGTLYGETTLYDDGINNGWVVHYRPLRQINSQAERAQSEGRSMTSWLSVESKSGDHWDTLGTTQLALLKYSVSQLFRITEV